MDSIIGNEKTQAIKIIKGKDDEKQEQRWKEKEITYT